MKYIDILKNFDKAIITESQKLKEIYDELCKGETPSNQVCNETEDEVVNPDEKPVETEPTEETPEGESVDTEKVMREFATEDKEADKENSVEEPTDNEGAVEKPTDNEGAVVANRDGGFLRPEDFFGKKGEVETPEEAVTEDGKGEKKKETCPECGTEPCSCEKKEEQLDDFFEEPKKELNESEDENKSAIPASELFAEKESDDKDMEKPVEEEPAKKETVEVSDVDVTVDDEPKGESCEGKSCKTAADWLGESDAKDNKNEDKEEEDKNEDKEEEDKNKKCPKCQNNPCSCNDITEAPATKEDDEEMEARQEAEALEESIKNISAFVKANKKLFVG